MTFRPLLLHCAIISGFAGAVACATVPATPRANPRSVSYPAGGFEHSNRTHFQTVGDEDDEGRGGGGRRHGKHHHRGGGGSREDRDED